MELSLITNQAGYPVLTKNGINAVSTKVIDNKSATGNYTSYECADKTAVLFVVSGTFVADVTVYGVAVDTNSNVRLLKVVDFATGLELKDGIIKKPGTYIGFNDRPYSSMFLRINAYTSGAVTAHAFDGTNVIINTMKKHIIKIAESLGVSVSANSYSQPIQNLPVDQFAFITFVARTNGAHAHKIGITFVHTNSLGSMSPEINIIDSTKERDGETDWIPVKGEKVTFTVHNNSDSSHAYDIDVYGVN